MKKNLDEEWVERIWQHSVLPYIEEQFFGEETELERFDLDLLRTGGVAPETEADQGSGDASVPPD